MWKKLTYDLENFLSFGYGKSNQNWFREGIFFYNVEIAKDIHLQIWNLFDINVKNIWGKFNQNKFSDL